MPPHEECPICQELVEDWHVEWYKTERSDLYRGLAALDCPLCGQPVGFVQGKLGRPPSGVPTVHRSPEKAAEWAVIGASYAGGTLDAYIKAAGAGSQYATYWSADVVQQADATEQAKQQGP